MKLYEITGSMTGLQALADTEELTDEMIADTMDGLKMAFSEKAKGVLQVRQSLLGEAEMIDAEIARLAGMVDSIWANARGLEKYLKNNMLSGQIDKLDLGLFKVTLRKSGKKLGEIHEELVPDEYFNIIPAVPATQKLDKRALLAAAKVHHVDGVLLVDSERALVIK
mgnify:FL=1